MASELRVQFGGIEVGTDIAITVHEVEERLRSEIAADEHAIDARRWLVRCLLAQERTGEAEATLLEIVAGHLAEHLLELLELPAKLRVGLARLFHHALEGLHLRAE